MVAPDANPGDEGHAENVQRDDGVCWREFLRRSEALLREFVETLTISLHWVGSDGTILWANQAELDLLGYTREEYVGRNIAEFYADPPVINDILGRLSRGDTLPDYPAMLRHRDGSVRHVVINSSAHFEKEQFVHTWCFTRDVTAIRQEQDAMLLLTAIVDSSDDAIISKDLSGRITSWNKGAERIFGYTAEEAVGQSITMLIPEDRQDEEAQILACVQRGEYVDHFETIRRCKDGTLLNISVTISPLKDREGRIIGASKIARDITAQKRREQSLRETQRLESLGLLASGIAHDFNNLLGGVLAQADLALMELASGSHPEDELHRIRDVAIRGAEIVRQLMIYAGKESEDIKLIDVSRIITEMLDLLKVSAPKQAALETDLDMDLPAIRANPAQLRQIVMNLITNASEAMGDRDGVIRVTTGRVTLGQAAAISKGVTAGDYVQLEVSDTGGGMPPETQARVFDPFFTTKSAGRGLGLAVVQGIVRKLRGAIHLASEPSKGTTFQILLPCITGTGASAGPIPHAEEGIRPWTEATVLVVEDEDPLRQAVAKMLRKSGFEVLEAANGSTAIDLLRANSDKIDAILLDLTIPGRSSQEVVADALQVRPDLKVILTSAYSEEMVMTSMSSPLIRGFIRKPFRLGDLLQTFQNVLFVDQYR